MSKMPGEVIKFKENKAKDGEEIFLWGKGYVGEIMGSGSERIKTGHLIVTSKRVVFYSKWLLGETFEEIEWSKVSSVERGTLMMHSTLKIYTSGNTLEFKSWNGKEVDALEEKINSLRSGPSKSTSSETASSDPIEQIRKLELLKRDGVITEAEFTSKKEELLRKVG